MRIHSIALMKPSVRFSTTLSEMWDKLIHRMAVGDWQVKTYPGWLVVLGRPKTLDAFVTHMKRMRCPCSVGRTWLVDFSGSACAPRMPMWGSLEMVPGAPEDHPCSCKGHNSDFQPTTWEEHKIGWPLCAPSSNAGLHKGVHCWTASLS